MSHKRSVMQLTRRHGLVTAWYRNALCFVGVALLTLAGKPTGIIYYTVTSSYAVSDSPKRDTKGR